MFEKQIDAGIKFLNEKVPGWDSKINLERLDMVIGYYNHGNESCGCIGAQLDAEINKKIGSFDSFCYNFNIPNSDYLGLSTNLPIWKTLTSEWKNTILRIREEQKLEYS